MKAMPMMSSGKTSQKAPRFATLLRLRIDTMAATVRKAMPLMRMVAGVIS
jgi:hypothetical protein